ncbi:ribonuclease HII [Bacillus sp. DNRA2]|uniref:ribonuclease HII n=1 Tax=Bacillus sp. DNRA2 TaxID=2723053 RepID=UPI00145CCC0B|nr:ribonuclease HII [Bacillus sp. DNRA2]NMD69493.1 ribonuclease HII [Bacillus sp. DNRA2]
MEKLTISQIEVRLKTIQENEQLDFIKILQEDDRKGVQQLLARWQKEQEHRKQLREKFLEMSQYEQKLRRQGYQYIAGIDEVGRGPLAGPVVAAAVILPENIYLPGVDDSKKLSEQRREELYAQITEQAIAYQVGIISAAEIDQINIYEATKKAMLACVAGLSTKPDFLLIDAMKLTTPYPYEAIIKGDAKSISIAAASIVAKVTRDRMMKNLHEQYPDYGFVNNMGYGTKEHLEAIKTVGITSYHRKSFAPIKDYIGN